MRKIASLALMTALVLGGSATVLRAEDEREGGDGGGRRHARLGDDVRMRLSLGNKKSATPLAKIQVKNRGTNRQDGVLVRLFADSEAGTELWSAVADIAPGRSQGFRVTVTPPSGAVAIVATATLNGVPDERPSDNTDRVGLPRISTPADAAIGAGIYSANGASCHGTDARGTGRAPGLLRRSAGDIWEAIHEGEDGMPTFPGLSANDVRALAAFLKDPGAVTSPPPPPAGTPPTWTGQVKALLDANCNGCHAGTNASGAIRLDTYAGASANASAALSAVQAGRMPKDRTPLTAGQIQILSDWIGGGMLP